MKKILLVDDQPLTRLMISQTLAQQDASYEILESSNGREACEIALEAKPDLILMDIMMPVMDGYEALAGLKCRCGTHMGIIRAVKRAAKAMG